jgi:hypothetical protein
METARWEPIQVGSTAGTHVDDQLAERSDARIQTTDLVSVLLVRFWIRVAGFEYV